MASRVLRSPLVVVSELFGLAAISLGLAALAADVAAEARGAKDAWLAGGGMLLGVALADLLSGVLHWVCDTFFEETTPYVGPTVIATFREHHRDPMIIVRHGVVERIGLPSFGALAIASLGLLPRAPLFVSAVSLGCSAAVLATNQIHAWAHAGSAPRVVRWLQRRKVILSPEAHAAHHARGDERYCVTTGWTGALLDRALALCSAPRRSR